MFGYQAEEVLGDTLSMLLPDALRDTHPAHIDDFVEEGVSQRQMSERPELLAQRKNGETFPTEVTLSRLDLGKQRVLTAIVRDVTEHRRAEKTVRESEMRYRNLFEHSPIAMWEEDFTAVGTWLESLRKTGVEDLREYLIKNPDEVHRSIDLVCILDVNPAGVRLIGADSREQLLGGFLSQNLTEDLRRGFIEELTAIWEDRDRCQFEMVGNTFKGDRIDLVFHWAASRTENRLDLSCVVIAMDDITDRKTAERSLKELVRSKDEFIASVSHELRTPLTGILGFIQLLRDPEIELSPEERLDMLNLAAFEAFDVANIVEDLLVAARAEIGTLQISRVPVDLRAQVSQVLEAWEQGVVSHIRPVGGNTRALGDPGRVRQILRNLITNALRYGGEKIKVELSTNGSTAQVEVSDNGPGIPPEDQSRIFEAYHRAHTDPGRPGSVGLGLAVSRNLARLMDGDLTYRYQHGESTFELSLPTAPRSANQDESPPGLEANAPNARAPSLPVAGK
jgi:PAS domain S-box-containing protein